jgi:hypothetical protein
LSSFNFYTGTAISSTVFTFSPLRPWRLRRPNQC